jgi:L-rhamnose mutarotase
MRSFGLTLCLRDGPDVIDRYREAHRRIYPRVVERMREVGIREMRIWLIGRRLFMYVWAGEEFEPRRDFARIDEDETSRSWNALMRELQERAPEAPLDDWWSPMELVFDTSWSDRLTSAVGA